ncbi:MAG TPA: HNH endonuclease [Chloroflexia bacterium]|nr:HNH endonuclease [Chloroflexia bacterium]
MKSTGTVETMRRIAQTDRTFERVDGLWLGKCLICNGRLSFRDSDGFGANIEHIFPRVMGGDDELTNLGLTHPQCNGEKGRHWDNPRRRRFKPEMDAAYRSIVERLQARRLERWRDPDEGQARAG